MRHSGAESAAYLPLLRATISFNVKLRVAGTSTVTGADSSSEGNAHSLLASTQKPRPTAISLWVRWSRVGAPATYSPWSNDMRRAAQELGQADPRGNGVAGIHRGSSVGIGGARHGQDAERFSLVAAGLH
jgi:hypothetical protein